MLSNEKSQSLRISIQDEDAIFEISFKIKEEVKKIITQRNVALAVEMGRGTYVPAGQREKIIVRG
jgi:hypothetical protein